MKIAGIEMSKISILKTYYKRKIKKLEKSLEECRDLVERYTLTKDMHEQLLDCGWCKAKHENVTPLPLIGYDFTYQFICPLCMKGRTYAWSNTIPEAARLWNIIQEREKIEREQEAGK